MTKIFILMEEMRKIFNFNGRNDYFYFNGRNDEDFNFKWINDEVKNYIEFFYLICSSLY